MSRYFSIFATESQWAAAAGTLDYPHVSLIDSTGDLKYLKTKGYSDLLGANFGDIIIEDITENKLYAIAKEQYTITSLPLESYKPIAVCIQDLLTSTDQRCVFLSTNYVNVNFASISNPSNVSYSFYQTAGDYTSVDLTSEFINTDIQQYFKDNSWKTTSSVSLYGNNNYPVSFVMALRFKTSATNERDWLLPSKKDLTKYVNNFSSINQVFEYIKTETSGSYCNTPTAAIYVANTPSGSSDSVPYLTTNGTYSKTSRGNGSTTNFKAVRPVFIAGIEEF